MTMRAGATRSEPSRRRGRRWQRRCRRWRRRGRRGRAGRAAGRIAGVREAAGRADSDDPEDQARVILEESEEPRDGAGAAVGDRGLNGAPGVRLTAWPTTSSLIRSPRRSTRSCRSSSGTCPRTPSCGPTRPTTRNARTASTTWRQRPRSRTAGTRSCGSSSARMVVPVVGGHPGMRPEQRGPGAAGAGQRGPGAAGGFFRRKCRSRPVPFVGRAGPTTRGGATR